jgi:hypothetical protein
MLRLDRVVKPWRESGALNAHINLFSFWNDEVFITKSGDLGIVLRVRGVDYESLDQAAQEYSVKRLEAALKIFGPGFHVYQYLFKTNRPEIPFQSYDDPIVQAAVNQRKDFFASKLESLFEVEIFYAILLEGTRSKTGVTAALKQLATDPMAGLRELKAQFSNDKMKVLLREHIEADLLKLEQRVNSFIRQLADFLPINALQRNDCFRFFRRLVNYDSWRIDGRPVRGQFLDYQVVNSDIEAERDHLRVGNHFVRVLTMKEAIGETKPLVLKQLLEIQANFCIVTEWVPSETATARKEITKRKRHFNITKTSFITSMQRDPASYDPRNTLMDESKQADIENLGDCLRAIGGGQSLGEFSLTVALYAQDKRSLDRALPEVVRVFTSADGNLFSESYNQLNAYFAIVPGNYRHNLRRLFLLNTNYADLSFLFTILPGEKRNDHLGTEYLAVLETDHATPYFLNLHNRDVAHTLILGATGAGKTMKLEDIKSKTKDAVDYLVQSLESGHSEVLTQYLGAIARFHTYSFGNVMLIARQKPDATNVAGIRTWNSLGRFVKRGEKGILILAPMVGNRRSRHNEIATDIDSDNAADERKPESQLVGFRAVYVFDISQTEGKELPTLTEVQGDVSGYRERLFEFLQSQGVELSYSERIAPAKGLSHGGKITLLSGMKPAEEFSTLVHEIAHEMLHRGNRRTLTTKKVRETEAEAVAFVVGKAIGLETGTASTDYIQLWHGDANLLRESLEAVQQTAAVILGAVAPKLQTTQESDSSNLESGSVPCTPLPSVESAAESVPF